MLYSDTLWMPYPSAQSGQVRGWCLATIGHSILRLMRPGRDRHLKGIATSISPDRTRLISILLSNSRLPGHLSPDLWHSMLIILILLIHATTRQQWNASWQSKRRRSAQILSTAIVTVARNSNGNETGRDASWRASLPCARVKMVKHSKLHIRFSDAKTVDGYSG